MQHEQRKDAPICEPAPPWFARFAHGLGRLASSAGHSQQGDIMSARNGGTAGTGGRDNQADAESQATDDAPASPVRPSQDTLEWDALTLMIDKAVADEQKQIEQDRSNDDGPLFKAYEIGPQAYRDPRLTGFDWRESAPEGSKPREDAEKDPIKPSDPGYQTMLHLLADLERERTNS